MSLIDSFETDDIFNRKIVADNLTKILNKSEELRDDSFVVAIDSSWGTGKSVFIKKWINEVNTSSEELYENLKATVIYYNSWENDDSCDAFTPLAYHIYNKFESLVNEGRLETELVDKLKDTSIKVASSFARVLAKRIGIDDEIMTTLKQVIDMGKDTYNKVTSTPFFDEFKNKKAVKDEFRKLISEIPYEIKESEKLIIVIDELDRCRPTFAIETLEIIKHYFNIDNIIFVLSLDIEQLGYAIATIYGQNMDAVGYLRRFIDVIVKIPTPEKKDYIKENTILKDYLPEIVKVVTYYDMSIRDINKFLINIELFYDSINDGKFKHNAFELYIYLIAVKLKYPNEFKQLLTDGNITDEKFYSKNKVLPKKLWDDNFMFLTNGGNLLTIQEIINDSSYYKDTLNNFIDKDDLSNNSRNILLSIGKYIFEKIEMCVLDDNTQILKKK